MVIKLMMENRSRMTTKIPRWIKTKILFTTIKSCLESLSTKIQITVIEIQRTITREFSVLE